MCVETTETLVSSCLDRLFQHVRTGQFERFGPRTLSDRLGVSTLRECSPNIVAKSKDFGPNVKGFFLKKLEILDFDI